MADIDPLEYRQRSHPDLDIASHGLTFWDLDREFVTGGFGGKRTALLRDILGVLRDSYCRTVGIEYMHIQDPEQRAWFQERLEQPYEKPTHDEQLRILGKLNEAEAFETFLQTKYVGQKRFSLEGGESTIALLDAILQGAAEAGLDEVAIGMAHRGRLNVLTNIAGKTYGQIFREFEGTQDPKTVQGSGDVKYHLGTEGTFTASRARRSRSTSPRTPRTSRPSTACSRASCAPSRTAPATASSACCRSSCTATPPWPARASSSRPCRCRSCAPTDRRHHPRRHQQPGRLHDAAAATAAARVYSTDVAKTIQAPIFHVNGDDPEAVVRVAELAFAYRQKFKRDVVIDLVCYRRRGHNEGDDPSMTQPLMYNLIEAKRSVRTLYTEALVGRGDITQEEYEAAHARLPGPPRARLRRDARGADRLDPGGHARPEARRRPGAPRRAAAGRQRRGRAGVDRRRPRCRRAHRRRPRQPARRLHGAPEAAAAAEEALRDEPQRRHRLGLRRAARARLAAARGHPGAPRRPGHAPRHVRVSATRCSTTARTARSGCRSPT